MNHLTGKVVIVTGASGGFGRLICQRAATLGAHIVAADVNAEALDELVAAITTAGGSAIAQLADVRDLPQMMALASVAVERFGAIDVMINNAGVMPLAYFADHAQAAEAWSRCIDINIKGVLNGMIAVYDQMISQGRGHVVNISSIYGNYPGSRRGGLWGDEGRGERDVGVAPGGDPRQDQGHDRETHRGPGHRARCSGIVNPAAFIGIVGQNAESYLAKMGDPNCRPRPGIDRLRGASARRHRRADHLRDQPTVGRLHR